MLVALDRWYISLGPGFIPLSSGAYHGPSIEETCGSFARTAISWSWQWSKGIILCHGNTIKQCVDYWRTAGTDKPRADALRTSTCGDDVRFYRCLSNWRILVVLLAQLHARFRERLIILTASVYSYIRKVYLASMIVLYVHVDVWFFVTFSWRFCRLQFLHFKNFRITPPLRVVGGFRR